MTDRIRKNPGRLEHGWRAGRATNRPPLSPVHPLEGKDDPRDREREREKKRERDMCIRLLSLEGGIVLLEKNGDGEGGSKRQWRRVFFKKKRIRKLPGAVAGYSRPPGRRTSRNPTGCRDRSRGTWPPPWRQGAPAGSRRGRTWLDRSHRPVLRGASAILKHNSPMSPPLATWPNATAKTTPSFKTTRSYLAPFLTPFSLLPLLPSPRPVSILFFARSIDPSVSRAGVILLRDILLPVCRQTRW